MFHSLANRAARFLSRCILALICKRFVLHAERSARPGACILAANHISHFDPPVISVAARRKIDWMGMSDLFKNRWAAAFLRALDSFPTDRDRPDRAAVRTTLQRLKRGHIVGLFPERGIRDGARSVLEGAPIGGTVAALAELADAPILPCVVLGTDRLYDWKNWLPLRRIRVWVGFGDFLQADRGLDKEARREKLEKDLALAFPKLFIEMQHSFSLTPDDFPQSPQRRMGRE